MYSAWSSTGVHCTPVLDQALSHSNDGQTLNIKYNEWMNEFVVGNYKTN